MSLRTRYLRKKFWLKDFLDGSPVRKQFKNIKYIAEHSYEEGLPQREAALHRLLRFVQKYSAFYNGYESMQLSAYPVMSKTDIIVHYEEMRIPEEHIPKQVGSVFVQKTSGSTGTPLAMPQDTMKRKRRIAEIKYYSECLGFKSHEKMIQLRTWNRWQTKSRRQIKDENIIPFDIKRLGEKELENLCNLIEKEKPVCIRGYASTFGRIANVANRVGFKKSGSLKIIVSTSESLEDDIRANVKNILGCDIASQYANEECGILAQERVPTAPENNAMYFNHASYFFEVLKMENDEPAEFGELGRIVVTDLYNYAFPVIRYDTGDTCILGEPDEFSKGYPVIERLFGRRFDLTYTTTGTPIYPLAYGRILKNFNGIIQWQFLQKGEKTYQLNLVLKDKGKEMMQDIKTQIQDILGDDASIALCEVENIPVLTSGKRKPVVNEWKQK